MVHIAQSQFWAVVAPEWATADKPFLPILHHTGLAVVITTLTDQVWGC